MNNVETLLGDVKIPRMAKARLYFSKDKIEHVEAALSEKFRDFSPTRPVLPGQQIAITCGSRGIANAAVILKGIVDYVKSMGGIPFIVPAMGSHGGATAEGQRSMVESLGINEEIIGCEIRSSMDTVELERAADGEMVYVDKNAFEADAIILFNRIKAHTSFRGKHESGLLKMMVVGLGKQKQAVIFHNKGPQFYEEKLEMYAEVMMRHLKIVCGVGVVENAYDETAIIEVLNKEEIWEEEKTLLKKAFGLMPSIPIHDLDVLIVDEIGKEISGNGMDPNITGRFDNEYTTGGVNAQRCVVLDLTDKTHGNITGLGMADLTTQRASRKISYENSLPNVITNNVVELIKVPAVLENDRLAIQAAIATLTFTDKEHPRMIRIKNTADLNEIYVSEALKEECSHMNMVQWESEFQEMDFDSQGNLF